MDHLRAFVATVGTLGAVCLFACLPAQAANCPGTLLLESTNGHDYVAVFSAKVPMLASFRVEAYGKSNAYAFTVANVAIDKDTSLEPHRYRSPPTLFANPGAEPLVAALVQPSVASGSACADSHVQIPSVASVTSPERVLQSGVGATQQEVRREVAALPSIIMPDRLASMPFACDRPFAEAQPLKLVSPAYPGLAAASGATGRVEVKVSLDETGGLTNTSVYSSSRNFALDGAALEAARKSTYSPEVFACKAQRGDYLFIADFQARSR